MVGTLLVLFARSSFNKESDMTPVEPRIIAFDEVPAYVNDGGRNQLCRDFMAEGEIGHVVIGHNVMQGDGRNGANSHSRWHQIFVVTKGQGTMMIAGREYPVDAPRVIIIPAGAEHDMRTAADQSIGSVYVNDFLTVP